MPTVDWAIQLRCPHWLLYHSYLAVSDITVSYITVTALSLPQQCEYQTGTVL